MTVSITQGSQVQNEGTYQGVQNLTQSTATAEQSVSVFLPVTTLSGGTATGFGLDRYVIPAGSEGMHKTIVMLATGEAKVRFGAATTNLMATAGIHYLGIATATGAAVSAAAVLTAAATGALVLDTVDDYLEAKFWNGSWHLLGGLATVATAT